MDTITWIFCCCVTALIYVFIIKPRKGKKALERKMQEEKTGKEEGRFYFYEDRCSFKLDSELKRNELEEEKKKYMLTTEKVEAVIWILPQMPVHSNYPWIVGTEKTEVGGYPCDVAYSKSYSGIVPSYFIDCGDFVVQVNLKRPYRN